MLLIKKQYVTLIEMMIVMFLIAIITGVVAYNYKGTLDESKAFKTKTSIQKIETILNLEVAKNPALINHINNWQQVIEQSPMVQNPNAIKYDGWGELFQVTQEDGNIKVYSQKYQEYKAKHNTMFGDEAN